MALDGANGYVPEGQDDNQVPIFDVQQVRLRFDLSADLVAAEVANNVLILALATGRILRFDLDSPEDIDDIDLPKRPSETGVIRKLFLDPSASHLIISTTLGETYYLHTQSRTPKPLTKAKGIQIECIGWNPSHPTSSTREILIGATDGSVYETYIEPTNGFNRSQDKYLKSVYNPQDGAVVGLYVDTLSTRPETCRVLVATRHKLEHFSGKIGGRGHDGSATVYAKLFENEAPSVYEIERTRSSNAACLAISPDPPDEPSSVLDASGTDRAYAWLCAQGIFNGKLLMSATASMALGKQVFRESQMYPLSKLPAAQTAGGRTRAEQPPINSLVLTQCHMVALSKGRVIAINRLDGSTVYNQQVLEENQATLGLFADHKKNTFWLFTSKEILEIVATDETRDVWRILLAQGQYEAAQRFAKTEEQKDVVAAMTGEHLISQGKFSEAAVVLGKSSKAFEDVTLSFIDKEEHDALRKYLLVRLSAFDKDRVMQRIMLASWLVELYMAKLNQLDDTISSRAELAAGDSTTASIDTPKLLSGIRKEYQDFVTRHKFDLDGKTVYEIISAHGREEELLFFANAINDYNYVLSYWIQRERWTEAIAVLKKQTEPEMFYRYSAVLMTQMATELVDIMMRQNDLDPKMIIPALLNYNKTTGQDIPLNQNQAVRYLLFCVNHAHSTDPAVHNTLISMYAAHPTGDESALLSYLQMQLQAREQNYDADFALRLCIAHKRVQSAVHVYGTMEQYASAVDLALKYDEVELAAVVADRPGNDNALRKKLWLKVAKKVIGREKGIKSAIEFLKRCELLRIEDLIPFFPDFVVIDDFKEEICAALEDYSRQIDELKHEMDESANTAQHIKDDIKALDQRYAIVEPGERCWKCRLPLLMRQFFVFPCQHAFHADCLGGMVMSMAGMTQGKRIRELQEEIGRGVALGNRRVAMVKSLDALVAGSW